MLNRIKKNNNKRIRRAQRARAKIANSKQPRLTVFRSNKAIFVQIIDDQKGITIVSAHTREIDTKQKDPNFALGQLIAKKASDKNIKQVVFDKGGYKYHGRIKAVADGARDGGLQF